jgi:hypothetical protein
MEMNLQSDVRPFQERVASGTAVEIPATFFVDARLSGDSAGVAIDPSLYAQALAETDSRFPPTAAPGTREARHARQSHH